MTGGTVFQTIQFHYSLSPMGNVDRLADMIEKRKYHAMTAFKSGPFMFACGGVKDQKTPMDRV